MVTASADSRSRDLTGRRVRVRRWVWWRLARRSPQIRSWESRGADRGGLADEGQKLTVDLGRVGDAHQVRAAVDLDVLRMREGGVQAPALTVDRQDPIGGAVQDQRRDVDALDVLEIVVEPRGHTGPRRPG